MPTNSTLAYLYEEDITGNNPLNKVVDELALVTPGNEPGSFNIIVPKMGPYFRNKMVIEHVSTGLVLTQGVDWQPSHVFYSASHELEWVHGGVYGSILLMNRNLTGVFKLVEYQTLGGEWLLSNDTVLEILSNRLYDPRTATYEQVAGKPNAFPPLVHDQPIDDLTTFADVIIQLGLITQAVEERTQTWLDNPPILMTEYYTKGETQTLIAQSLVPIQQQITTLSNSLTAGLNARYTKTEADARYVRI